MVIVDDAQPDEESIRPARSNNVVASGSDATHNGIV
jgi:hypothetical protein